MLSVISMLKKRVITALWSIPLLIATVWFDRPFPWFTIIVAIWGLLAVYEFYRLVNTHKMPLLTSLGLIWTLLFIISPHFKHDFFTLPLLLTSAVVLSLIGLVLRYRKEGAFIGWAWTIAGILYVGWLLSHFIELRGLTDGRNWVFFALFITWASDTTAFFVGKALGRHHLVPNISPAKTWEGAVAGIGGAIIMSVLFFTHTPFHLPLSYGQAILLSMLVSVFGQLGDLVESLLKRNVGVKDSGGLIPGHGGFLDRIDSVVFAVVVVYYYVIWVTP